MASMRFRILAVSALALGLSAPLPAQTSDDAAIHSMIKAQESAFNTHDAAAYGQFLEGDADMVTSLGWWVKGRDAYVQKLGEAFAGPLGRAHVHADEVTIRALGPDLALAHIKWTDTAARKDGEAIESQVLHKQADGRWLIAAAQETDVKPERAAATGKGGEEPATVPQPTRKCLVARANGDCLIYK
jgi:uncharacterized protein (TIGR02246 family)